MLAAVLLSVPYNGFPRTLNATAAISAALEDETTQVELEDETTQDELSEKPTVTMQVGNTVMTVNGVEQNIDEKGTAPVMEDGRVMMPIDNFVESIGGQVQWDEGTQTVTLSYNGIEIKMTVGSDTAYDCFLLGTL